MKIRLFLLVLFSLLAAQVSASLAADQVCAVILVDQGRDEKVVDKDFEKHIYDSLKDIIEAQGYKSAEKGIVEEELKQNGMRGMKKRLNVDMIISAQINPSEGGMEESIYERELGEYKESAGHSGYLSHGSGKPGPASPGMRSKKRYSLTYQWLLARSDRTVHMGIVGGNSRGELEDELKNKLTRSMSGFTYLRGHIMRKGEDFVEINLGKRDGAEAGDQITLFVEGEGDFKDIFDLPGSENMNQIEITEVFDEYSLCRNIDQELLSEMKEGDSVEYLMKKELPESKEERNPFLFWLEGF